jgi:glutaconate CoA-transferase subunit B
MPDWTSREMMAIAAGRLVGDGALIFAGTGLSMLAAVVAKRIHAPHATIFFETGGIDPALDELPLAVGDPRVMSGACLNCGLIEAFSFLAHRRLDTLALLGAAQIDRHGNLNSTAIGDYRRPTHRLPGSGGACDAASLAAGMIIFVQHEKRRFVPRLDYLTSPGWLAGGDSRARAGYVRGGPRAVVSDLGVLRFDATSREMYLAEVHPGITAEQVAASTGFPLDVSRARPADPPTERELDILRREVDPQRLILG